MEDNETTTSLFDLTELPTGKAMVRSFAINAAATAAPIAVLATIVGSVVLVDAVKIKLAERRIRKSAPTQE
jgi:hypothetical protein